MSNCTDCIHDQTPDAEPVILSRRDMVRKYGIRGAAIVAASALGLSQLKAAKAGYMYMGRTEVNGYCYSECRWRYQNCAYYRNEYGQSYFTDCYWVMRQQNCCAAFGRRWDCCQ